MFCNYRKYSDHRIVLQIFLYISFLLLAAAGCGDKSTQLSIEYLVKVNDRSISVEAFNSRYETISAEFPISEQDDPGTEKVMKLRLLQQLVEELILLERAEELKLSISDSELAIAVEEIQADYPEGEFEKILLNKIGEFEQKGYCFIGKIKFTGILINGIIKKKTKFNIDGFLFQEIISQITHV